MADTYLTDWYLEEWGKSAVARGFTHNSPKFGDSSFIHTSEIVGVEVDEQKQMIIFHTVSGSKYVAAFADIKCKAEAVENTRVIFSYMNIPASFLDKAFVLAKEKNKTLVSSLEQNLVNGDLYLQLGAGGIEKVYFKYEEKVQKVSCRVHSGMSTDSYLYTILGVVDFRHYEFIGNSVDTYHMSDSIKRLVVNNVGAVPVTIDHKVYKIGQTVTCVTEENHPEGLFSPDVFNGKGLFSNFIKEGDSNV